MKTHLMTLGIAALTLSASALAGCTSAEPDDDGEASALTASYAETVDACLAPVTGASGGALESAQKKAARCLAKASDAFAQSLVVPEDGPSARGSLRAFRNHGESLCAVASGDARTACLFDIEHMAALTFRIYAEGADLALGGRNGADECNLELEEPEPWASTSEIDMEIERVQSSGDCYHYRTNRVAGEAREAGTISSSAERKIVAVNVDIQDALFGLCEAGVASQSIASHDEERLATYTCAMNLSSAFHDAVVTMLAP